METILFLSHTEADGTLPKSALDALAAAKALADTSNGSAFVAGLIGEDVQAAADSIAGCGATSFFGVSGADFAQPRYATDTAAAEAISSKAKATIIIAPATSRFSRILSGVSHRLDGKIDTHVADISSESGEIVIKRWYYKQRMEAAMKREIRPWILSIDPGSIDAWLGEAGSASVESVCVELSDNCKRTTVKGTQAPAGDEQTIRPEADLLFVAGAGWTKTQSDGQTHTKDAEKLILDFLHTAKASLGGSKSMVDLSSEGEAVLPFMTHLNQVGQTGATPRHPKGLATCCHGEEPHVVGWRFINERRAINSDASCGWAQGKADVLYVADAFEVVTKVNELLSSQ